ncbi:MAG TPA: putative phage tail protein [Clostridia bacterium]|nr:putative phage tail protein [Clostridia bacterium]
MRKEEMLGYLPPHWRSSKVFEQVMGAEGAEFDSILASIEDIETQLDIDRATWGLAVYEKELGLQTDISKPLDDRRSVVKSKLRGTGKADAVLLKLVADAYTNGDVEVTFPEGVIHVRFDNVLGAPPNMADLTNTIEELRPAHLPFEFEYLYLMLKQVEQLKIGEINEQNERCRLSNFSPFKPIIQEV